MIYVGKNITEDLSPYMHGVTYTDNVAGESDEISFTVDDREGLWKNQWRPAKKDRVELWMGYNDYMFPCGAFEIDELELSGPPDVVTVRAMAAPISKGVRTKKSYAHEGKTLQQLASKIAGDHGLTLQGIIRSNIMINRSTQYRETDLAFLNRISKDFGYIFSVRDDKLIFTSIYDLESKTAVASIHKKSMSRYSINDKTSSSYKSAKVRYTDPVNKELVEGSSDEGDDDKDDTLEIRCKVENVGQADAVAKAKLHDHNSKKQTGRFTVEGNVSLLSGVNVEIIGLGRLSGVYQITQSSHTITPGGGYITNFSAKKVAEVDQSKWL